MKAWLTYENHEGKPRPTEYGGDGGSSHTILFLDKAVAENVIAVSGNEVWIREIEIPDL